MCRTKPNKPQIFGPFEEIWPKLGQAPFFSDTVQPSCFPTPVSLRVRRIHSTTVVSLSLFFFLFPPPPELLPNTTVKGLSFLSFLSSYSASNTTVLTSIAKKFSTGRRELLGSEIRHQCKRPRFVAAHSDIMGPRWKGKGAETEALSDPMSKIVSQLQSSLALSNSQGLLMSSCVLLEADTTQTDLLLRSCFGDPLITAEKDKQWFQLSMEEAFYLFYVLKCIKIVENNTEMNGEQLWMYMSFRRQNFPYIFKAYSHLRTKNWIVKSGSRYGVDFVAYRHHPRLVHSEYAVLVLAEDDRQANGRLRVWSDYECTLRLCGSVAKTLLVLYIEKNGKSTESPSNLESFLVEEQTITRWSPQQSREDQTIAKGES